MYENFLTIGVSHGRWREYFVIVTFLVEQCIYPTRRAAEGAVEIAVLSDNPAVKLPHSKFSLFFLFEMTDVDSRCTLFRLTNSLDVSTRLVRFVYFATHTTQQLRKDTYHFLSTAATLYRVVPFFSIRECVCTMVVADVN